nr:hypothetical protein [uncultured Lachnoclostridium sp.]
MACVGCHRAYCPSRCPDYIPKITNYYCSICGNGIYDGEIYIKNDHVEYAHWDCIDSKKDLAEWLDYEIKIMEED